MSLDRHAVYYVAAYAATALVFAWMLVDSLLRARRARRRVDALEAKRGGK